MEIRLEGKLQPGVDAMDIILYILSKYGVDLAAGYAVEYTGSVIREMAVEKGYAAKPKDYKKHPEDYKGHVGHVSTVIRIALTGRSNSPDIWEIQQILGEKTARARMQKYIDSL